MHYVQNAGFEWLAKIGKNMATKRPKCILKLFYNVSLSKLLQQGISEPQFYGDLVYRISKIVGEILFFGTIQKAF